jgi:nitrogen fixation protein FixH
MQYRLSLALLLLLNFRREIMNSQEITVQGTIRPDGSLELDQKVGLPPGRVRVTVEPVEQSRREDTWTVLQRAWAERQACGLTPRSKEEIDAQVEASRAQWDERMDAIERLQRGLRKTKE